MCREWLRLCRRYRYIKKGAMIVFFSLHNILSIGEPEFVERMQRTYHDQAVANKVTIVHSCGFDSVSITQYISVN